MAERFSSQRRINILIKSTLSEKARYKECLFIGKLPQIYSEQWRGWNIYCCATIFQQNKLLYLHDQQTSADISNQIGNGQFIEYLH